MKLADIPSESEFLDVDGIAVVRLPDGSCVAFETGPGADPVGRAYPNEQKAGMDGDSLSLNEFATWLATGRNRFDVSAWRENQVG